MAIIIYCSKSNKRTEQRMKHSSVDINFDNNMVAAVTQEKFLSNKKKILLISMLAERFQNE